jgi:hypothetical protein
MKKPDCKDFIIAVAREIRIRPGNTKPGISAGVRLENIFEIAKEKYSEQEFRVSLETLMRDETIVVVVREKSSPRRLEVSDIRLMPGHFGSYRINAKGLSVTSLRREAGEVGGRSCLAPMLYILEDGVPAHILRRKRNITASEVIAKMSTS